MPRKPSVRYFTSRGAFYCQFRGRQVKLAEGPDDSAKQGPVFRAAVESFGQLMAGKVPTATGEKTVADLWESYSRFLATRRSAATLKMRRKNLQVFLERFGALPVGRLTAANVYDFLDGMRLPRKHKKWGYAVAWKDGSVRNCVDSIKALLNWSVRSGLIEKSPVGELEKPSGKSRGEDAVLTQDDHAVILANTDGALRDYCVVLEATGARPGEITTATAANFDPTRNAIVFKATAEDGQKRHKTHRTGRDRVIFLVGDALEIVKRRVELYPRGPIFGAVTNGTDGTVLRHWSDVDISSFFRRLRERSGVKVTAYSYRHTFATRWLMSGRSIEKLAALLGNSPAVIMRHYAHLMRFAKDLRSELEDFRVENVVKAGGTTRTTTASGAEVVVGPLS
jgi:integrase